MKMTVNPEVITETKVVVVKPATYTVELSEKEAIVISSLLGNVFGPPSESEFRRVVDQLYKDGFGKFIYKSQPVTSIAAPIGDMKV